MIFEGFVGPTYQMDAVSFDNQRSVNLFPITSESGTSKSVAALRGTAGLEKKFTLGGGPIRGTIEAGGRSFWVSGSDFYEGDETNHGMLLTATSRCTLHYNGTQIFIVDGTYGYIFTLATNTFEQITDVGFPSPCIFGAYQDNYFIAVKGGTAQFYISAIGNGLSWDVLDFTTVESSPDDLVGAVSDGTSLWMLGQTTVEIYTNTGNAAFPFERQSGAVIQTGCAAPHTAVVFDGALTWLGQDDKGAGIVWRANGYSATKISTQSIEKKISSSSNPIESYAYTYHEQGHAFYILQVKGISTTLCCDATTGYMWHEKSYRDPLTNEETQHKGSCHVFFDNMHLVGDRYSGTVYRQALDIYSDDGDPIKRTRISPHIQVEKNRLTHSSFKLDMETGVGLEDGSDPQVMLRYSDDGGHTWSYERTCSFGKIGSFKQPVEFTRLGDAIDRVYEVSVSDPVFVQINQAYING